MLTLRQLQYFLALAELRHFGKAAERCCVTQPALSMQIKELEDELGLRLIERKRGNIELTPEGKDIAARAQAVQSSVRELQDCARFRSRILAGSLRLGVIPSIAPYLLPSILPTLQARYPDLQLHLHETLTGPLVEELIDGSLDAVILALPVPDARVETISLFDDRFLLARRRRPIRSRRQEGPRVDMESLKNEKLLLLNDGHCLREQALSYCTSIDPGTLTEFGATSLATIMQMVAAGYGVTLLPEIAVASELTDPRIELCHFAPPGPQRTVGLAWRKTAARRKDFIALARLVKEAHEAEAPRQRREADADEIIA